MALRPAASSESSQLSNGDGVPRQLVAFSRAWQALRRQVCSEHVVVAGALRRLTYHRITPGDGSHLRPRGVGKFRAGGVVRTPSTARAAVACFTSPSHFRSWGGRVKSLQRLPKDRRGSSLPINRYFFSFFFAALGHVPTHEQSPSTLGFCAIQE